VGLAEYDRTEFAQPRNDGSIGLGGVVGERCEASTSWESSNVDHVLEADGDSVQGQDRAASSQAVESLGLAEGTIAVDLDPCLNIGLGALDLLERGLDQIAHRELALPDAGGNFAQREVEELVHARTCLSGSRSKGGSSAKSSGSTSRRASALAMPRSSSVIAVVRSGP